jgi:hypothetical protein
VERLVLNRAAESLREGQRLLTVAVHEKNDELVSSDAVAMASVSHSLNKKPLKRYEQLGIDDGLRESRVERFEIIYVEEKQAQAGLEVGISIEVRHQLGFGPQDPELLMHKRRVTRSLWLHVKGIAQPLQCVAQLFGACSVNPQKAQRPRHRRERDICP